MRLWALVLVAACGKDAKDAPPKQPARDDAPVALPAAPVDAAATAIKVDTYPDLATALKTVVTPEARVVGFGEIHVRTDRVQAKSSLARFTTDGMPALQDGLSDLIIETWIVDPKCGQAAKTATAKVEMKVRRPAETKSEIALLAEAARAAKVQPHAMRLSCADYERVAPKGQEPLPDVMLTLITKELTRIANEAVRHRDKQPGRRPWIALYGGALHNDRFPTSEGVADWSYAASVDEVTGNRFVEIDLVVPELAETDPAQEKQPWFPLLKSNDPNVRVWKRGERSFVVVFPRGTREPVEK